MQFHLLCVSEAANAAASGRCSISDVPNGAGAGLSNSIDISKVGQKGFTEGENGDELCRASVLAMGVTSVGELGQELWNKFTQGNTKMASWPFFTNLDR